MTEAWRDRKIDAERAFSQRDFEAAGILRFEHCDFSIWICLGFRGSDFGFGIAIAPFQA
jgi:hypothetical protein